jgi:hypothetical protein
MTMNIIIGSARSDENGNVTGGKAGDQKQASSTNDTKGEVSMQNFYVHTKGWNVLRAKQEDVAAKIAAAMKTACNNANVGYDQSNRNGVIKYGTASKTQTECDCSSLVRQCVKEASGIDSGDFNTGNEAGKLAATGLFENVFAYASGTVLYTGDILVTKTKGHTAVVVTGNERTTGTQTQTTENTIWQFLSGKGLNDYAVAGIMGNLYAESGLSSINLQNSYNKKLGMTDEEYTDAVDNGSYANFVKDSAGYGLAQWTYYTRKQALLDAAKSAGESIGSLNVQLAYLWKELQGYKTVMASLQTAASVRSASDAVLKGFEKPADQSEAVQKKRAGYGQTFYDKHAGQQAGSVTAETDTTVTPFNVRVDILNLNIRTGAGTDYEKTGEKTGKGIFTITEVKAGKGSTAGWGKLKSGAGWISLDYCTRI